MAGFHLDKFIPQNVVTAQMIMRLWEQRVFKPLIRSEYKETLGRGQSYQVPFINDVTIGDYDGTDITTEYAGDTNKTITIDQAKYFAVGVDKVDDAESAYSTLNLFLDNSTNGLAQAEDAFIATTMAAGAGIVGADLGTTGVPLVVSEANVLDTIALYKQKMDENNVSQTDRKLVVPPFMAAAIAVNNIETASTTSEEARSTGFVQRYLGFDVYMSNNLVGTDATTAQEVLAFVPAATVEVETLQDVEVYSPEKRFASAVKGIHVYGAEVLTTAAVLKSVVSDS